MDLTTSMTVVASRMRAQSDRMRIIAENLANANSTSTTAGGNPYRRQVPTVRSEFDRQLGVNLAEPGRPVEDMSKFRKQYDPGSPAANKQGYVKLPNVNPLIEIMDMREAQRSYEMNSKAISTMDQMLQYVTQNM